jgi:hypothetical protein
MNKATNSSSVAANSIWTVETSPTGVCWMEPTLHVLDVLGVIGIQLSTLSTVPAVAIVPWVTGVYFSANTASAQLTDDEWHLLWCLLAME